MFNREIKVSGRWVVFVVRKLGGLEDEFRGGVLGFGFGVIIL